MDTIWPRRTVTSCDPITRSEERLHMRASRAERPKEVTMNVETVKRPIEPQSAIMKGN